MTIEEDALIPIESFFADDGYRPTDDIFIEDRPLTSYLRCGEISTENLELLSIPDLAIVDFFCKALIP